MSQGRKDPPPEALFVYCDQDQLGRHIPKNHFYEQLDEILDLSFVRELTAPLYAERIGRPSLDPVVFFKAMLIGYFEGIAADTELEFRLADSLLFRRFLGYGLDQRTPDESTLRKTRQKMPEEAFQAVFEHVLQACLEAGLVRGRALGCDTTLVDANASSDSLQHRELGCSYEDYVLALRRQDNPEASRSEATSADRHRPHKGNNTAWGSTTDPEARMLVHADKHTHLSYQVDATVDLETGVVVAAGAETATVSDQDSFLQRVDEGVAAVEELGCEPRVIVADKGHHSGANLAALSERGLIGLVSAPRSGGPKGFQRDDFEFDAKRDEYVCPAGQRLTFRKTIDGRRVYQQRGAVCRACEHFGTCTTSRRGRSVTVSEHVEELTANRERVLSEAARPLLMIRRQRGEAPFAHWKVHGGLRRLTGRGLEHATKRVLVAAMGWNLLRLVRATPGAAEDLCDAVGVRWKRFRCALSDLLPTARGRQVPSTWSGPSRGGGHGRPGRPAKWQELERKGRLSGVC